MKNPLDHFTFISSGNWVNEADCVSFRLNEDYGRTYHAYRAARPYSNYYDGLIVTNKNGNPIRFRSTEAAAAYLMKHVVEPQRREREALNHVAMHFRYGR